MEAMSYTLVRSNFAGTMEKVCNDHSPIIVTRKNAESVIIMSLKDYNSLMETSYLLGSPKNAAVLAQSIKELEEGKVVKKNLKDF
jgi:antitoxin YefM